jgi:hypothetical protein
MAGRAFTTGQPVTSQRDGSVRVWVPEVPRGFRTVHPIGWTSGKVK